MQIFLDPDAGLRLQLHNWREGPEHFTVPASRWQAPPRNNLIPLQKPVNEEIVCV